MLICLIAAQVLIIVPDGFSWLQPAIFAVGLALAVLGVRLRRDPDPRSR